MGKKKYQLLDKSWLDWIALNVKRGCDHNELHGILVQNGFDPYIAKHEIAAAANPGNQPPQKNKESSKKTDTTQTVKQHSEATGQNPGKHARQTSGLMIPTATKLDTDKADAYVLDHFLSETECMRIIRHIRSNLRRSTTTNAASVASDFRTSSTCDLGLLDDNFIQEIDQRICHLMGLAPEDSETIQGQWYEVGQEFKAHTDYFEPNTAEYEENAAVQGQRTWTVMIYLNTVRAGGQTHFHHLDTSFQPVTGKAVIWNSLNKDGTPNPNTLHHAQPVEHGFKAIITKWFRSKTPTITYHKEANEYLPPLTRHGFTKQAMPAELFKFIKKYYQKHKQQAQDESVPDFITSKNPQAPSQLIELDEKHKKKIHTLLQPIIEAWAGTYLEPTYVYGIRNYLNGSSLKIHRDRLDTHIVSAILNIDQDVNEDWPLYIEDHHYRGHEVILKPGEMVLYEGERLRHGRPTPLDGEGFANVFVHYKLS